MQAGGPIPPSTAPWPFPDLLFREMTKIELIEPWRCTGHAPGVVGRSLLAGAMALHLEDLALVCTSPLRYLRSGLGTQLAATDAESMLSLGYRIHVVDSGEADLFLPSGSCRLTLASKDMQAHGLFGVEPPLVLFHGVHEGIDLASINLRLLGSDWFQLSYRSDLDGAIEFAPCESRHQLAAVNVTCPTDELGWLHPASAYPFVLDDQYWRTATPCDWPWPLAREWRSQPNSREFRQVMKTALLARFQQHPALRRRLLALQCTVSVAGVPAGLIEEVACLLRKERLVENSYA